MSSSPEKREQRLQLLEDDIGRALAASERSGELARAPSYGKPLALGDGYGETPAELRMGYKILKDAGVVPAEVDLMQRIAALRQSIDSITAAEDAAAARRHLLALQQQLALMLERLGRSNTV